MGRRTISGFIWNTGAVLAAKALGLLGQVVLAWLLLPEDFGLVGLALTMWMFASLIRTGGLREVLIHRHLHFSRWCNAAFWMSMITGGVSGLLMLASAPVMVRLYDDGRLGGLIAVLALVAPIDALRTVPEALLQTQLRFKTISCINVTNAFVTVILSVILAWMGMGPYSFVLPRPIASGVTALLFWVTARPRVNANPELRLWRYLFGNSMLLLGTGFAVTATLQGDYILLGYFHGPVAVGLYFFAFNLSTQTTRLLGLNLAGVLLPVLSRLQREPQRRLGAFTRASSLLAAVAVPLCMLQSALADPLVRLLFEDRWYSAIPLLQILSLGMIMRVIVVPSEASIKAQGKFGLSFGLASVYAAVFLVVVSVTAWQGSLLSVACAVAGCQTAMQLVQVYVAIHAMGGGWKELSRIITAPLIAATASMSASLGLAYLVHRITDHLLIQVLTILIGSVPIYLVCLRAWAPELCRELTSQVRQVVR